MYRYYSHRNDHKLMIGNNFGNVRYCQTFFEYYNTLAWVASKKLGAEL